LPKKWATLGVNPEKYEVAIDDSFHGERALVVQSKADASVEVFSGGRADNVMVYQTFGAANYLGRRIRFSAFLKTEQVAAGAGLSISRKRILVCIWSRLVRLMSTGCSL
jgi:hypothetical protein